MGHAFKLGVHLGTEVFTHPEGLGGEGTPLQKGGSRQTPASCVLGQAQGPLPFPPAMPVTVLDVLGRQNSHSVLFLKFSLTRNITVNLLKSEKQQVNNRMTRSPL